MTDYIAQRIIGKSISTIPTNYRDLNYNSKRLIDPPNTVKTVESNIAPQMNKTGTIIEKVVSNSLDGAIAAVETYFIYNREKTHYIKLGGMRVNSTVGMGIGVMIAGLIADFGLDYVVKNLISDPATAKVISNAFGPLVQGGASLALVKMSDIENPGYAVPYLIGASSSVGGTYAYTSFLKPYVDKMTMPMLY